MKQTIAREWLKLIGGLVVGLTMVLPFIYTFVSPDTYKSKHSIGDAYSEWLDMLLFQGVDDSLVALVIILGPYICYQFVRSLVWAYKTLK